MSITGLKKTVKIQESEEVHWVLSSVFTVVFFIRKCIQNY